MVPIISMRLWIFTVKTLYDVAALLIEMCTCICRWKQGYLKAFIFYIKGAGSHLASGPYSLWKWSLWKHDSIRLMQYWDGMHSKALSIFLRGYILPLAYSGAKHLMGIPSPMPCGWGDIKAPFSGKWGKKGKRKEYMRRQQTQETHTGAISAFGCPASAGLVLIL